MTRKLVLLLFVFSSIGLYAQKSWKVTQSTIGFSIKNAGFNVKGTFAEAKFEIIFDTALLRVSKIISIVKAKSINTGINSRDKHLTSKDFFDVDKFPSFKIVSSFFSKNQNIYKGYFKLTIKDITKDITIPFTFEEFDNKGIFKSNFTINRLDFGVGDKSIMMSDNVNITITLNVEKK